MTVDSYLTSLAVSALVRDPERSGIERSISTLEKRLIEHFNSEIENQFIFGSYSRNTLLPRGMDPKSDIDYMIVFSDSSLKPQTYLDKLKRFAEKYYIRSEIFQSNPTIILSLDHMLFELVPAINGWFFGLQIPAKASDYQNWLQTDPKGFNDKLNDKDRFHRNIIKPLIRLVKYWNVNNGYPFESYRLEKDVVDHWFVDQKLFGGNLCQYFFEYITNIDIGFFPTQRKEEVTKQVKQLTREIETLEKNGNELMAIDKIKKFVPPLTKIL